MQIHCQPEIHKNSSMEKISQHLDMLQKNPIKHVLWNVLTYEPKVSFSIAYNDCIFLKYFVKEKYIAAKYLNPNDPVYKDTCVEFFISFDKGVYYYNIEFNCLGTILMSYGCDRDNRLFSDPGVIKKIRTLSRIRFYNDVEESGGEWELTVMVPLEVFTNSIITSLHNKSCKANFFKCGDELPEPHYLAWNKIISSKPNFHLTGYFEKIKFM
jgi:hypothetical protein